MGRGARRSLPDRTVQLTPYRLFDRELRVPRADGDERMSFHWDPDREHFTGGAGLPRAYDPDREDGDTEPGAEAAGRGLRRR